MLTENGERAEIMLMNHTRMVRVGCGLVGLVSTAAFAEPVRFHAWFEGPAQVEPGEVSFFNLWVGAAGAELDDTVPDALATLVLSLRVSGDLAAFASHTPATAGMDSIFLTSTGMLDGPVLRDVAGMQNVLYPPPFPSYENPIRVLTFGILTSEDARGQLSLTLEDGLAWGPLRFVWYINTRLAASDDPANTLIVDPFSFRVIPAPATVGVLALATLGVARRRR